LRNDCVRVFRVKMPRKMADEFDNLIERGDYVTYADAIRNAIKLLLEEHGTSDEKWLLEPDTFIGRHKKL